MSILKSTNSGQKLWWHRQLDELVEKIYGEVDSFPSNRWDLTVYYSVPTKSFVFERDRNPRIVGTTTYMRNKMVFSKRAADKEIIRNRILSAFTQDIERENVGNYTIEDIPMEKITMETASA